MPIRTSHPITVFDQESFHQVDKRVTGLAFGIHNELGRCLDERLHQGELAHRCVAAGFDVVREMQITVSLDDFCKYYFVDHLVNGGVVIETKAAQTLTAAHKGQALNYLFLCGLRHGTLLNFRTESVQHEFVSTSLTLTDRFRFQLDLRYWTPLSPEFAVFETQVRRIFAEWGAFLDPTLYREALVHFLGGEERVSRPVEVFVDGRSVGMQKTHLLTSDVAFAVTAATQSPDVALEHQQRFLRHTKMRAMIWLNLNHSHIELRTLER